MAKSDPKITIAPELSLALDALAKLEKTSKRALIEEILRRGLRRNEVEMQILDLVKTMATQTVLTSDRIELIADFIADRLSHQRVG
ncbi:MAG: hypothetical protein Devi2KO_04080 [Devosia indica]